MIIIKIAQPQTADKDVQDKVNAYLANPETLPAYMEVNPEEIRQDPQNWTNRITEYVEGEIARQEMDIQDRVQEYVDSPYDLPPNMAIGPPHTYEELLESPHLFQSDIERFVRSEPAVAEPMPEPEPYFEPEMPVEAPVPAMPEPQVTQQEPPAPEAEMDDEAFHAHLEAIKMEPPEMHLPELYEAWHAESSPDRKNLIEEEIKESSLFFRGNNRGKVRTYINNQFRHTKMGEDRKFQQAEDEEGNIIPDFWEFKKEEWATDPNAPRSVLEWVLQALNGAKNKNQFTSTIMGLKKKIREKTERIGLGRTALDKFLDDEGNNDVNALPPHLGGPSSAHDRIDSVDREANAIDLMLRLSHSEIGRREAAEGRSGRATQRYGGKVVSKLLEEFPTVELMNQGIRDDIADARILRQYLNDKVVAEAYRWSVWDGAKGGIELDSEGKAVGGSFPSFEDSQSFAALENLQKTYALLAEEIDAVNVEREQTGEPKLQKLDKSIQTVQGEHNIRTFVLPEPEPGMPPSDHFWEQRPDTDELAPWPPMGTDPITGEDKRTYRTNNNHHDMLINRLLMGVQPYILDEDLQKLMEGRIQARDATFTLDPERTEYGGDLWASPAMAGAAKDESTPQGVAKRRLEKKVADESAGVLTARPPQVHNLKDVYNDPRQVMKGDVGRGFVDEMTSQDYDLAEQTKSEWVQVGDKLKNISKFVNEFYEKTRQRTQDIVEGESSRPPGDTKTMFFNLNDFGQANILQLLIPMPRPGQTNKPYTYSYGSNKVGIGYITPIIPRDVPDRDAETVKAIEQAKEELSTALGSPVTFYKSPEKVPVKEKKKKGRKDEIPKDTFPGNRVETNRNIWENAAMIVRGKEIESETGVAPNKLAIESSILGKAREMAKRQIWDGYKTQIDPEDAGRVLARIDAADAEQFSETLKTIRNDATGRKERNKQFSTLLDGPGWQNKDRREETSKAWDVASDEEKKESIMSFILSEIGATALDGRSKSKNKIGELVRKVQRNTQYRDFLESGVILQGEEGLLAEGKPKGTITEWSVNRLISETAGKAIASFLKAQPGFRPASSERRILTAIIHELKAIKLSASSRLMIKVA